MTGRAHEARSASREKLAGLLDRHVPTAARLIRAILQGRFETFPPRLVYAAPELHHAILERFNYFGGTFFEAGANDGLSFSNTAYLERYLGWRGVLVEAIPHKFVECRLNRPKSDVLHAALVGRTYQDQHVRIRYSNLMSIAEGPTRLDVAAHVEGGKQFLRADRALSGEIFVAPARTVSEIFDASGLATVDLFSLDVEGSELEVLEGIDFSRHRPKTFIIETDSISSAMSLLNENGYERVARLTERDFLVADARCIST